MSDTQVTDAESSGEGDDEPVTVQHGTGMPGDRPRRRLRRFVAAGASRLLVVVSLVALVAGGGWLVTRAATPPESTTTSTIPGLDVKAAQVAPGSKAPEDPDPAGGRSPEGDGRGGDSDDAGDGTGDDAADDAADDAGNDSAGADDKSSSGQTLKEWAAQAEPVVGVPERALYAYGNAAGAMHAEQPDCGISWATLAAIGRIESDHGRYGGATLRDDGYPSDPIIGVSLDGSSGVDAIPDTDDGVFDGDRKHDRAVGPMQFIPSTWKKYASDGNGDGSGSPHQIDDAALAAARYLCAGGRDMASAKGWWQGIQSYNNSIAYAKKVFGTSEEYAERAQALTAQ